MSIPVPLGLSQHAVPSPPAGAQLHAQLQGPQPYGPLGQGCCDGQGRVSIRCLLLLLGRGFVCSGQSQGRAAPMPAQVSASLVTRLGPRVPVCRSLSPRQLDTLAQRRGLRLYLLLPPESSSGLAHGNASPWRGSRYQRIHARCSRLLPAVT